MSLRDSHRDANWLGVLQATNDDAAAAEAERLRQWDLSRIFAEGFARGRELEAAQPDPPPAPPPRRRRTVVGSGKRRFLDEPPPPRRPLRS